MFYKGDEMQVSEEEILAKCRSDEPNFKHKKYLRSKFEEAMMIEASFPPVEANVPLLRQNKLEKVTTQPPLPPNPPPPDTPPMIKQEIEDDDYKCGGSETSTALKKPEEIKSDVEDTKTDQTEDKLAQSDDKPTVTMCRNFARGTCKKGAACIFAHELILAQLPGVYTFCRNFQNSVCSFPKCKFVHATVFEKEHFYRTGYLPPHSLAHLKEATVADTTPPAPPSVEAPAEQPTVYCNPVPPPPPQISCMQPVPVGYNPEPTIEQSEAEMFRMQQDPSNAAQNTEWSQMTEVGSATLEHDSGEPRPKKCKNCGTNDLRERLLDAQIDEARRRRQERIEMNAQLDKKIKLISTVLGTVLKSNTSNHSQEIQRQLAVETDMSNSAPNSNNNHLMSMLAKVLMNMESEGIGG